MRLRVGRFGVEITSGEVQSISDDGATVRVSGVTAYASAEDAEALRQQLLGYVDSADEPFVPVVWAEQPEFDGYYRVTGASVSGARGVASQGVWDFSVDLERVTGFAAPLIELRELSAIRANTQSLTEVTGSDVNLFFCVPGAAKSVVFFVLTSGSWQPFNPDVTRETATGDVLVYERLSSFKYLCQFYVTPDRFYDGAATILAGDRLVPVVGRQVPSTGWRLSNGLFEIEPGSRSDGGFGLRYRFFLDGVWQGWAELDLEISGDPDGVLAPHSMVVLRNSPQEVAIRLLTTLRGEYSPTTIDLSLRRGVAGVGFELQSVFTSQLLFRPDSTLDTQTADWWVAGTTNAGWVTIIGSNQEIQYTSGVIRPYESAAVSVKSWSLFIGAGETLTGDEDAAKEQLDSWFMAGSESLSVVLQ